MSSDKSLEFFPQNKSYKFKSHLSAPLLLEGTWRIALVEADISCTLSKIKVITKLPNSEQSYKGKVKTHNYINRQNQSTTGKL
jgi:hypothetical protein